MSSLPLPDANSPTLELVHATDTERVQQWTKNGAEWRGALSEEAYMRRERYLMKQSLTENSGITHWVLVDTSEPTESRRVLCGCESLRKRGLVASKGTVEDVIAHGIGSVFCPPEHRRRGYAQRMMRELGVKLQTHLIEGTGMRSLFTVLWSDIGKQFYANFGWKPFPSSHISVTPDPAATQALPSDFPQAVPLSAGDLTSMCAADERHIRATLSSRPVSAAPAVALIPDVQTIQWHHARENFVANEIFGKEPSTKGASVEWGPGGRAWCYWTRMWYNADKESNKGNTLHILRLVVEEAVAEEEMVNGTGLQNGDGDAAAARSPRNVRHIRYVEALLRAAQVQAAEWHMEQVELWNPTPIAVEAAKRIKNGEVEVVHREEESIPSLMWYGSKEDEDRIEWLGNEKYGWC